jgi:hypothetical protein
VRPSRAGERLAHPDPVVDVEDGLELGPHAVRPQDPLDRADDGVLLTRRASRVRPVAR